jgi:hypothetical protein
LVAHERGIAQARMEMALRKCMLDLFAERKKIISEINGGTQLWFFWI